MIQIRNEEWIDFKCFKCGYIFEKEESIGISIRFLKCEGMGWMIRIYFAQFKFWFNLRTGR